jgi:hypothetical protein
MFSIFRFGKNINRLIVKLTTELKIPSAPIHKKIDKQIIIKTNIKLYKQEFYILFPQLKIKYFNNKNQINNI